jgi:hypothetical protein
VNESVPLFSRRNAYAMINSPLAIVKFRYPLDR